MIRQAIFILFISAISFSFNVLAKNDKQQKRIAIVSSYHAEYKWSQGTNEGLMNGLLEFGYLQNQQQIPQFTQQDHIKTDKVEIKKFWMDTKRKNTKDQIAETLAIITQQIDEFQPDILLLGDDNAANYVGNFYLDTDLPIVFWGVNGSPLKYGLLDSIEQPGHNVTGIYQKNYHKENLDLLLQLIPAIKTVAILSDDSATGLSHTKLFQKAVQESKSNLKIKEIVITNQFAKWQQKAQALNDQVDAFLISSNQSLKDEQGQTVPMNEVLKWYLKYINKPEVAAQINFVRGGMLATVFDSPIKQGYETAKVAHDILSNNKNASDIPAYAPEHGGYIVNQWRAENLNLSAQVKEKQALFHETIDKHVELD